MKLPKLFLLGLAGLALASPAMAQKTFFDEGITLQGKTIDLGYAGRVYKWAAIARNGSISASTSSNTSPANIDFEGNVSIGDGGSLVLSNSRVLGDVFIWKGNGSGTNVSGSGGWSGAKHQTTSTNSIISTVQSHMNLLATNIVDLTKTTNFALSGFTNNTPSSFSTIRASGSGDNTASMNLTIDGLANNPFNTPVVLKLTDFVLNEVGGTQLTLIGSATTKFIVNVTGQFSLSNSADVILSGGLQAGNVIFNVGDMGVGMSGASTLEGILLAKNKTIAMSGGSTVFGQVMGKSIALSGGSKVKKPKPPKPSP